MTDESERVYRLVPLSSKGPLLMEFSSEAAELIRRLGRNLHLEPAQVLSRALGLLELWDETHRIIASLKNTRDAVAAENIVCKLRHQAPR
jgi:hypothetical protein